MYLGIDIGGTNVSFGLVTDTGVIVQSFQVKTAAYTNASECLEHLYTLIQPVLLEHASSLQAVGIGAPMLTVNGVLDGAANMLWPQPIAIHSLAEGIFEVPVFADNDANCTLIGEWKFGQLKGVQHGVMVTLGTGVGGGLLLQSAPYVGAHGYAGEIGHIVYEPNGRKCKCGRRGCYEKYIAAEGMVTTFHQWKTDYPTSILGVWEKEGTDIEPLHLYKAAQMDDVLALKIYDYTAKILAELCLTIVCTYNPEKIILFGGLLHAGNVLLAPTLQYFNREVLSIYKDRVAIGVSEIKGSSMAILGAAGLCFKA